MNWHGDRLDGEGGPLVSIGLPVYSGENFLQEAIDSLLAQTWRRLELILSDNGSTDGTEAICRTAAASDRRVRYFRHPTNRGAAANYNYTLEAARGEYFTWAAHDDVRDARFLEVALENFAQRPEASVVFPRAERIDADRASLGSLVRPDGLFSAKPHVRFRSAISCNHPALIVFGLMRRRTLERTIRHGNFTGADRVLAAELALLGPFVEIPEVLFFNREHRDRSVRIAQRADANRDHPVEEWFDPERGGRIVFPSWKRLGGYLDAIRVDTLTQLERLQCLWSLGRAMMDRRAMIPRSLARDLIVAIRMTVRGWWDREGRGR